MVAGGSPSPEGRRALTALSRPPTKSTATTKPANASTVSMPSASWKPSVNEDSFAFAVKA